MKTFFTYFGAKWRNCLYYPDPQFDKIIEPFCGAAGYSVRRANGRHVHLYDKSEAIITTWNYLINVSEKELRNLPNIEYGTSTEDEKYNLTPEQRTFIGWHLNTGVVRPYKKPSKWYAPDSIYPATNWMWGQPRRDRLASQLRYIRHWTATCCSYEDIPNQEATWFVDPPYQVHGKHYPHSNKHIDFDNLASWCKSRKGQYIVCEGVKATWLPFKPLGRFQTKPDSKKKDQMEEHGQHAEMEYIYTNTPLPTQLKLFEEV
jgi:site-specific DNA-adenine methylase